VRLLRADQIQPPDDEARMIAEAAETPVARLIGQTLRAIGESFDAPTIIAAIETGHFRVLWDHLALDRISLALRPALNRLAVVHDRSAIAASVAIPLSRIAKARPSRLVTPDVINLTYDPLASATVAAQNATNDAIAANIEATAESSAESAVAAGLAQRLPAAVIARRLRDVLGLTTTEAAAIGNYRAALQAGGINALARQLRDRRFDGKTRQGGLSEAEIDRMVSRYAERYRAFRAQRIARTETMRAANQGRAAAWAQYGALTGRAYRRFWLTAGDELVCVRCAPVPAMNPDGIGPNDQYATPAGPIDAPPDIHANCRCSERFERIIDDSAPNSASGSGVGLRVEFDYAQGE
jgi:hypothetical protein